MTVAARHLVAHGDLSLLGNVNVNHLVYAGSELVGVGAIVDLYVNDYAVLTVAHLERGILNLACLLTEDRTKESFLAPLRILSSRR